MIARLFAVEDELPDAKPEIRRLAATLTPARRAGDFAQGMMDLGATLCTPKKPACVLCPWTDDCAARARGDAETFPRKAAKREGRLRRGAAFVVVRADGHLLVRTRPTKGLLGGMTEVPTSAWTHDFDADAALAEAPRRRAARAGSACRASSRTCSRISRSSLRFTCARVGASAKAPAGMRWIAMTEIAEAALPNVMRKVITHALRDGGRALEPK